MAPTPPIPRENYNAHNERLNTVFYFSTPSREETDMNKLEKIAKQDAEDYGLALMFFGEGAGTRRKLISAVVDQKVNDIEGYAEAFDNAFGKLNQMEMAEKALAERKKIDRAAKAGKNLRALKSGNLNNLSTGVFVIVGAVYVAHVTGYDKKIEAETKKLYKKAKIEIKFRKARWQGKNVTKIA